MTATSILKSRLPRAAGLSLALAIAVSGLAASPAGAAITQSAWTDVGPPSAPSGFPASHLSSVSCPSKSICFAAGDYVDANKQYGIMVAKQQDGSWFQAVDIPQPKDSSPTQAPDLSGISCSSTSDCWAVGSYTDSAFAQQSMATHFNGTTWSRAKKITAPADSSGTSQLAAVACPSSATCVAVGNYLEQFHGRVAMSTSLVDGTWSQEKAAKLPKDATDVAPSKFTAVSCVSTTMCWAVGSYLNSRPANAPIAAQWSAGAFKRAIATAYPSDANLTSVPAILTSISCSGSAGCLAGGTYQDGPATGEGFTIVLHGTTWSQTARKLALPFDHSADPSLSAVNVGCAANLSCIVSDRYTAGMDSRVALTSFAPGRWGAPTGFPSEVNYGSEIDGISCRQATSCTAVGASAAFPFASKATSTIISR